MTKNFKLLLSEAKGLGLTTDIILLEKEVVEISDGSRKIVVKEVFSISNDPTSASAVLAKNKEITYRLWERAGIPCPRSHYFKNINSFPEDASDLDLQFPVVFKKSNGKKSIGVHPNIASFADLAEIVKKSTGSFIVQEMAFGKEYRLLIYKNRLLGALEHMPPQVIGNGVDTIAILIQKRIPGLEDKLVVNNKVIQTLKKKGFTLDSIPENNVRVLLLGTSCLSEGAVSIDRTDVVNEKILELAKKSARVVNMNLAGIDLICDDISMDPSSQSLAFLETNSFPSLSIHYTPMKGSSRHVIKDILEDIFEITHENK